MSYQQIQQDALAQTGGDKKAATYIIYELLQQAAQNGDREALGILGRATLRGLRQELDDFCRSNEGRLVLTIVNGTTSQDTVPASKSVHRRQDNGDVEQLELPYLDMLFEEIRSKIAEMSGQRDRLYKSVVTAARLLELQAKVPSAKTPRAALRQLGVTVEQWLVIA